VRRPLARRLDRHRARAGGVQPVHGQTHHVRAPVADLTAARLHHPAERPVQVAAVERAVAERSQPQIPIDLLGRIAVRLGSAGRGRIVPDIDLADRADIAVGQVAVRQVRFGVAQPLRAQLDRDVRPLARFDHRLALGDRAAGRLLDVHVLSALGRMDRLLSVPVVGAGDDHGIHVVPLEDEAVVAVHVGLGTGDARGILQPPLVDVAHRRHVHLPAVHAGFHVAQMVAAHPADADMPDRQPLVGSPSPSRQEIRSGHGRRRRRTGRLQKVPPRYSTRCHVSCLALPILKSRLSWTTRHKTTGSITTPTPH
jgi:hypothetical protein